MLSTFYSSINGWHWAVYSDPVEKSKDEAHITFVSRYSRNRRVGRIVRAGYWNGNLPKIKYAYSWNWKTRLVRVVLSYSRLRSVGYGDRTNQYKKKNDSYFSKTCTSDNNDVLYWAHIFGLSNETENVRATVLGTLYFPRYVFRYRVPSHDFPYRLCFVPQTPGRNPDPDLSVNNYHVVSSLCRHLFSPAAVCERPPLIV